MSRTSRAWSSEIWRASERAVEPTRLEGWLAAEATSLSRTGARVALGSVKISLGIGRRPCSKGSRLEWMKTDSLGEDEDDVEVSMESLMASKSNLEREREREREKEEKINEIDVYRRK